MPLLKINLDDAAVRAQLQRYEISLGPQMLEAVKAAVAFLIRYTIKAKLNEKAETKGSVFPLLKRQTGTLQRSVTDSWKIDPPKLDRAMAWAAYGSNLDYAYKHEYGGTYSEVVTPRHVKNFNRRYGSTLTVPARPTQVIRSYRPRRMFASAMQESEDRVLEIFRASVRMLIERQGQVVQAEQLRRAAGE